MKFITAIGGRKFVLTIAFMLVVVLNAALAWGMDWQTLAALGAGIGVYNIANAIKG